MSVICQFYGINLKKCGLSHNTLPVIPFSFFPYQVSSNQKILNRFGIFVTPFRVFKVQGFPGLNLGRSSGFSGHFSFNVSRCNLRCTRKTYVSYAYIYQLSSRTGTVSRQLRKIKLRQLACFGKKIQILRNYKLCTSVQRVHCRQPAVMNWTVRVDRVLDGSFKTSLASLV